MTEQRTEHTFTLEVRTGSGIETISPDDGDPYQQDYVWCDLHGDGSAAWHVIHIPFIDGTPAEVVAAYRHRVIHAALDLWLKEQP